MPQQICSLCCDKINDFYEFREMCAVTNEQTRKLLRLPEPQKPNPTIKRIIPSPADTVYDDGDEGVESIFGVLGGEEPEVKPDTKSALTKKAKKGSATATTSKKAARVAARAMTKGKIKKEITVFSDDGSNAAYSIIISDDDLDSPAKKRGQKRKVKDSNNLTMLLAPKELNQRERQREMEQKKCESDQKKKTKLVIVEKKYFN